MSGDVARNVGFLVGKLCEPDNAWLIGINGLDGDCRECRVCTGEETRQGTEGRCTNSIRSLQIIQNMGLE
jgi:hypothetical protein